MENCSNRNSICIKLLEIIEQKDQMINKQNDLISELVNQTAEQENIINELMKSHIELPY